MRLATKLILACALALTLTTTCNAGVTPADNHATTHSIALHTITDLDGVGCSATAIGPQALLTASHCEMPSDKLTIDDETEVVIAKIVRDGHDHSILYLKGARFAKWATVSLSNDFEPGERVYIFGNPDGLIDIYREGYMTGQLPYGNTTVTLYDLNGWFGDSGAALFNSKGEVVSVVSNMRGVKSLKLMGSFPITFSSEEITDAVTFKTDDPLARKITINPFTDILKGLQKENK